MDPSLPELRLPVPCDDARDFDARLADVVVANGVRIPTERGLAVSTRVAVSLVFRDGGAVRGEGVVDAHLMMGGRSAVHVRLDALERFIGMPRARPDPLADEPLGTPSGPLARAPSDAGADEPLWIDADAGAEAAEPDEPPEITAVLVGEPRDLGGAFETSGDVLAAVRRGGDRAQRAALALVTLALAVTLGGYAVARRVATETSPRAALAAHLLAADRLEAEGRLGGEGGAIAELLEAKRLAPAEAEVEARLARIAVRLERLGARALQRNDLVAARRDLEAALLAGPARPSLRAKLAELAKRLRRAEARQERATARAAARR